MVFAIAPQFRRNFVLNVVSMSSVFVSRVNPVTSKVEWVVEPENFDFHQEIARSAYADMLHDTERNKKYEIGLQLAIEKFHSRGMKARVLDIGTGTGLLSMMAVRAGADSVTACETFQPMAECSSKIIAANGFADKIKLLKKSSKDITVGPNGDMARRANILVTEVFDTELIGEGGLSTFRHAHKHLLAKDCIVVPSAANMYLQPVSSQFLHDYHAFQNIDIHTASDPSEKMTIKHPSECYTCPGSAAVHDLQLSQLVMEEQFTPLTRPIKIFRFDFYASTTQFFSGHAALPLVTKKPGKCHAILMWWDLEMDTEGKVLLSCAPYWAHPEPDNMQWRDHWMQAVYYPRKTLDFSLNETMYVTGQHDEYSLWFDVSKGETTDESIGLKESPNCTCGGHVVCSRPRLHQLNNAGKHGLYMKHLREMIDEDSVCLTISDGSYLSIMAAKLGARKVYALESHPLTRRYVETMAKANDITIEVLSSLEELNDTSSIDMLLAEPFYHSSHLPWHNLHFWYARELLLEKGVKGDMKTLPTSGRLYILPLELENLWKIRAPVGQCEGFDLEIFDKLIENNSDLVDASMEPQPLWEYPGLALADVAEVMTFDLTSRIPSEKVVSNGNLELTRDGTLNGVAAWLDFYYGSELVSGTGLVAPPIGDGVPSWDPDHRQAIHIVKKPIIITPGQEFRYRVTFSPSTGEVSFDFKF